MNLVATKEKDYDSLISVFTSVKEASSSQNVSAGYDHVESRFQDACRRWEKLKDMCRERQNIIKGLHDAFVSYGKKHEQISVSLKQFQDALGSKVIIGTDVSKMVQEQDRIKVCGFLFVM